MRQDADDLNDLPVREGATVTAAEIAAAWRRELPGVPTASIEVITPLWGLAKTLAEDRRRTLASLGVEPATLDLLSTLRRAGEPYQLTTRQLTERTLVTAGAISQRVARAEAADYVTRSRSRASRRAVAVSLTARGHELIDTTVRQLLTHEDAWVQRLSPDDRTTLTRLLAVIANSATSEHGDLRRPARKPNPHRRQRRGP
jgi:DNA-binding MarR family transcriptional regulator